MNPLFDDFVALSRNRFGKSDVLCPFCDHQHRKRRRTMRIWRADETFLGYHCARCSAKGWSKADFGEGRKADIFARENRRGFEPFGRLTAFPGSS